VTRVGSSHRRCTASRSASDTRKPGAAASFPVEGTAAFAAAFAAVAKKAGDGGLDAPRRQKGDGRRDATRERGQARVAVAPRAALVAHQAHLVIGAVADRHHEGASRHKALRAGRLGALAGGGGVVRHAEPQHVHRGHAAPEDPGRQARGLAHGGAAAVAYCARHVAAILLKL